MIGINSIRHCIYFFVISILIASCSNNPVIPPDEELSFDSSRFNWTVDTVVGWGYDFYGVFSPDTNDLFAVSSAEKNMIHINNRNLTTYNFTGFYPEYVGGLNSNDFYVGGGIYVGGINNYKPHLKKWIGGGFTDIDVTIPYDTTDYIKAGIINSPSDMWFATNHKLIRYNGVEFTSYKYSDTARLIGGFFLDKGIPTITTYHSDSSIDSVYRNYMYKLEGDTVIKVFQNTWYNGYTYNVYMFETNGVLYGYGREGIYSFNFPYFYLQGPTPPGYLLTSSKIVGNNLNDYICTMTGAEPPTPFGPFEWIYHWNGTKFSKENLIMPYVVSGRKGSLTRGNEDYFVIALEDSPLGNNTYFLRGTRKK